MKPKKSWFTQVVVKKFFRVTKVDINYVHAVTDDDALE